MALFPGGTLPWIERRFLKVGTLGLEPNSSGYFKSFAAGTSSPLATFSDADLSTANPVKVSFDADGRPTVPVFLSPTGYKFEVYDINDVLLYTEDDIEDIGQTFASLFGQLQSLGSKNVTSGYTVVAGDRTVTVASTGGPTPCIVNLPDAANYAGELCIKNVGNIALSVVPAGIQTIDDVAAAYAVTAAASPQFPAIVLVSDGVSNWWIRSSHKL